MKTLLSTLTMAIIALGSFTITPAYAHCGMCKSSEKSHKMKPCEKSMKVGKTCGCSKKAKHDHMKKDNPCKVCEQNDKRFEMNKEMTKGKYNRTEKGDYQVKSRGPRQSNYND